MDEDFVDAYEEKKVFVRLSSGQITKEVLKSVFRNYDVEDIIYKTTFAIVKFLDKESADRAIREIANQPPLKLDISKARKKSYYEQRGRYEQDDRTFHSSTGEKISPDNKQPLTDKHPNSNKQPLIEKYSRGDKYSHDDKYSRGDKRSYGEKYSHGEKSFNGKQSQGVKFKGKKVYNRQKTEIRNNSFSNSGDSDNSLNMNQTPSWLNKELLINSISESSMTVKDSVVLFTTLLIDEISKHSDKDKTQYKKSGIVEDIIKSFEKYSLPSDSKQNNVQNKSVPDMDRSRRSSSPKTAVLKNATVPISALCNGSKNISSSAESNESEAGLRTTPTPVKQTFLKTNSAPDKSKVPERKLSAWKATSGQPITLQVITKEENSGVVCLAMDLTDPAMQANYTSLFDSFASCCAATGGNHNPIRDAMMAVEVSDGVWYRARQCPEGWAFVDDGTIISLDKAQRVILCPAKFKEIPEFSCYFACDSVSDFHKINMDSKYSVDFVRMDKNDIIIVKISDESGNVCINGCIKPWEPTSTIDNQPPVETNSQKSPNRVSILDKIDIGDVTELTLVVPESLGQVCLMLNRNNSTMVQQYESLLQNFSDACEKENISPIIHGKVMAVKLVADEAWYRAVSVAGGWALLDDGHTVAMDKVSKCVLCPQNFYEVPEFCVLLTNALPLKSNVFYTVTLLGKHDRKNKVKLSLPNDPSVKVDGFVVPFAEFRKEQTMAELLDEKVNNSMIMNNVKMSCLTKLNTKKESEVTIVNEFKDRIYVRLCNENAKNIYFQLLDKLTLSGPKLSAIGNMPEEGDVVICKYREQYHRAIVDRCHSKTNKCELSFLDIGSQDTVDCNLLKIIPVWAAEVPIMTDSFTLSNVESRALNNSFVRSYLSSLIETQKPLKCVDLLSDQIVLEIIENKENVNDHIIDLITPNWKKIVMKDGILKEAILLERDVQYVDVKKGQEIKILHVLENALSISIADDNDLLKNTLNQLSKQFEEYCNAVTSPYLPRLEEICFYQHDDGSWCRGVVFHVEGDIVSVASSDYGSSYDVNFSKCRKMLKEFVKPVPFLAVYATISEIGSDPSEKVFDMACEILKGMDSLIVESVSTTTLGVYNIKIKGLAGKLSAIIDNLT